MYKQIFLKRGKEESLKRFHPWIFSGAIHHMDEGIEEGETVRVITAAGEFIAVGHYQIGSIAVRVLSFEDIEINTDVWCERLQSALDVRIGVGIADSPTNNTYRLVHGEGDYLPGDRLLWFYSRDAGAQCGHACLPQRDLPGLGAGDGRSYCQCIL